MKSLLKNITGFKNRLTRLNEDEPATKLALAVIVILDIFVLSIIFGGLNDHTKQLTAPAEYFPYQCRQIFITKDWTQANKIEKLQDLVLTDYNEYSYRHDTPFAKSQIAKMHPLCGAMFEKIRVIADHDALKRLFVARQEAAKTKAQLAQQYDRENAVHDTKLLENIANKSSGELSSMAASITARGKEIDRLDARIKDLNEKINRDPLVVDFWALARPGDASQRDTLIGDLNHFERIYLFRELLWQLLFLLPLLAIFSLWHSKSLKKDRNIQGLISAHLIIVVSIPIVIKVANLVLELVPYHFFKDLFKALEQLRIIALWHYFVIIIAIGVGLLCVFIIQKKIFSKERLNAKRLAKGACYSCGKTLPDNKAAVCPFCGARQFRKCTACNADTYISAKFCTACGKPTQPGTGPR